MQAKQQLIVMTLAACTVKPNNIASMQYMHGTARLEVAQNRPAYHAAIGMCHTIGLFFELYQDLYSCFATNGPLDSRFMHM